MTTVNELYSDESKWTKEAFARDKHGRKTASNGPDAECWCPAGALTLCHTGLDRAIAWQRLFAAIKAASPFVASIVEWNDAPERTFAEVKRIVELAGV